MAKKYCLCKAMRPALIICRAFGFFPICWRHIDGNCNYYVSKFWIVYSLVLSVMCVCHISKICQAILTPFQQNRELLLSYISSVNENIISVLLLCLIFINIYRSWKIAAVLNRFVELGNEDLLCQSTIKKFSTFQNIFGMVMIVQYIFQFSAIFMFRFLENFGTDWSYDRFLMPFIHNTSFLLHSIFGSTCLLSTAVLVCYETKCANLLNYKSAHPIPNFSENKICSAFFKTYKTCNDKHDTGVVMLKTTEKLEFLHGLFMQIQDNLANINQAFNPQLLLHITSELIVMVLHWYAVIIYFTYNEVEPVNNTNNFFHWYYVIVHSWAIYTSMNTAQQIELKIQRIKCMLLEYSTEISHIEEYQQIRIFVQQLHNYKGFSASGIFTVNLQIIAPICANILMYVLVAIQFKVPNKQK